MSRQYVTTAIDYPNAAPHMGHVLEKVLADVLVRWYRLRGDEVRFQIGTDEHGIKIQRAADAEGLAPQDLVDKNVQLFTDLYAKLHISYDEFIRTSNQKEHYPTVQALWKKLEAADMLEKRSYTGLYCPGCERFMTKRDLDEEGNCPNHKVAPEEVAEENWFFLMSKFTIELQQLLTSNWDGNKYRITPKFRENETLALLEQGLDDVSFSRPKSSLSWGVPVPGDTEQTMYVWCDALTNYISGLGYFTNHEDRTWWDDANITHVIGKDIARFHALIWPLMLQQAGVRPPDTLLIHGFLTSEGEKMSKSLGNVVVPDDVLEKCKGNPDPMRFYLSHEVPVGRDGDFSWDRFEKLYNSALRNNIGNLLNRVLVMIKKDGGAVVVPNSESDARQAQNGWESFSASMSNFEVNAAVQQTMELANALNAGMDKAKPWTLEGDAKQILLSRFAESLRHLALMLLPFIPDTAYRMSKQLQVPYAEQMRDKEFVLTDKMKTWGGAPGWKQVGEPEILFEPLE